MTIKSRSWRIRPTRIAQPSYPYYAVFFTDHEGREDLHFFERLLLAEHLFFKLATGILKGENFFDVDEDLVSIPFIQMFGVDTDDRRIVRKAIEDGAAHQLYCSIPGAGNEIFVEHLFRSLN
ncbi:hypothetical protein [Bradyrhizobium sp. McL0616]|uniref:hypothetical protein n=1 Tax=Bradyrhizobium sp. McL0616 TaxID=3415674 RepID=UPI003CF7AC61